MRAHSHDGHAGDAGEDDVSREGENELQVKANRVSYWTLLKHPPMAVLCFARIADPMTTTSIYSYLLFQLRYLSPDAPDAEIAMRAGVLVGAKTLAKVCTGVLWGMLADRRGRKGVLVVGLLSSCVACIGYGFSTSFGMALFWQIIQGAMSSEIAMVRTIVVEIHADSDIKVRSRALLLLVLTSSIGMLLGPLIGGFATHRKGLGKISDYPYALPNIIVGAWYLIAALGIIFVLRETLEWKGRPRRSAPVSEAVLRFFRTGRYRRPMYRPVPQDEQDSIPLTSAAQSSSGGPEDDEERAVSVVWQPQRLPFRQIWTRQVICTMITHFIITGHITTFALVWTIFLSTPISASSSDSRALPMENQVPSQSLLFGGGLGLGPPEIGTFTTCATVLGALLQLLLLPHLDERLGTVRVWRLALWLFPFAYFLAPFPALLASASHQSSASNAAAKFVGTDAGHVLKAAPIAWVAISAVMVLFMTARTGAQPPMVILINECVPHPSARGTVNTLATSVANLARTIFPVVAMAAYAVGLRNGLVAVAFWMLSILALVAVAASRWVAEGLDERAVLKKRRVDGDAARD